MKHKHTGHIDCHCCHHTDETVEEALSGGRIHLNSACFWSCCHARWDDFDCKKQDIVCEQHHLSCELCFHHV